MQYHEATRELIENRPAAPVAPVLMPYLCVRRAERKQRRRLYSEGATNWIGGVIGVGLTILALLGVVIAWCP